MNYKQSIESLLALLPRHISVAFAIHCCNDVKHLMNKESLYCLELVEKWLGNGANNDSATTNELIAAGHASYAASAGYAAHAANAAAYAARAGYAAGYAANAAAYAANASYAAKHKEVKLKEYHDYLVNTINDLTRLEKELFNLTKV